MPTFNPAPIISLADKIVTDINAATWTPAGVGQTALVFTARRVYFLPPYLPTDSDLHVDILPAEDSDEELADRGPTYERDFVILLCVNKVLASRTSNAESDALTNFTYALATFYDLQEEFVVTGSQRSHCIDRAVNLIYDPAEIDKNGRFYSAIALKFKGWYS